MNWINTTKFTIMLKAPHFTHSTAEKAVQIISKWVSLDLA